MGRYSTATTKTYYISVSLKILGIQPVYSLSPKKIQSFSYSTLDYGGKVTVGDVFFTDFRKASAFVLVRFF